MRDHEKSKEQLIAELTELRARVGAHEAARIHQPPYEASAEALSGQSGAFGDESLSCLTMEERRQHADARLRRHLDFTRAITNVVGDGIYTLDAQGRVTFANAAAERMLGWSEAELLGKPLRDLIHRHGDERQRGPCERGGSAPLKPPYTSWLSAAGEIILTRRDGTALPVSYVSAPIPMGGAPIGGAQANGAVVCFRDSQSRTDAETGLAVQIAVSRVLTACASVSDAAPKVLRAIGEPLGWHLGVFWATDAEAGALQCLAVWSAHTEGGAEFEHETRAISLRRGEELPGKVWETGEPAWLLDATSAMDVPRVRAAARDGGHSAMAFPVRCEHGVLGVVEFFTHSLREPDAGLLQTLVAVGNHIGLFIEREHAQAAARASDAYKSAILATALEAIVSIDRVGCIRDFNHTAEQMFGYRRDDVIGQSMPELLIPPSLREAHTRGFSRYLETGQPRMLGMRTEQSALRSDGTVFPVELAITRVDRSAEITFTAYIRDLTVRKRAEEERLRLLERARAARLDAEQAQRRLQFLGEASILLASSLDYAATLSDVVHLAVPRIADWCYVDLLNDDGSLRRHEVAHVDPVEQARLQEVRQHYPPPPEHPISRVLRTGKAEFAESTSDELLVSTAPDSHVLDTMRSLAPRSYMALPIRGRERTLGVLIFITTTSGRRYRLEDFRAGEELARRAAMAIENSQLYQRTEMVLRQMEQIARQQQEQAAELKAVFEAMPDGVFVCDTSGVMSRANAKGATILGLRMDQVFDTPEGYAALVHTRYPDGQTMPPEESPRVKALRGETVAERLIIRRYDTGDDRHILTSAAPVRDAVGAITGAVVVMSDITEFYRLEQQKDEFLSIASHELKTPLTSLKILTQLTRKRLVKTGVLGADQTQRMERAIGRMERLVNDLLDVSRIDSGKLPLRPERFDLAALCQEVAEEQMAASERPIDLDLPAKPLEVNADPDRIGQVLANLISNALKYSTERSRVSVRLARHGDTVTASVYDAGGGIPAEDLPHLFERFYRVPGVQVQSGSGVGLGLGLYISKEIVERHGGHIWVESTVGTGSTFGFTLPAATATSG